MNKISQETALRKIADAFAQRRWLDGDKVAGDIVRAATMMQGGIDIEKLIPTIPNTFFSKNRISRIHVQELLAATLRNTAIENSGTGLVIQGDGNIVSYGGRVMKKETHITNHGQFAGNVDSTNSHVNLDKQQQVLSADQERIFREAAANPEIIQALELPIADDEKKGIVGSRLAKLTNAGIDIATTFAAKLITEMTKG